MIPPIETRTMERLLAALDSSHEPIIRDKARAVLRAAFRHIYFDTRPGPAEGLAMSTFLVASAATEETFTSARIP